MKAGWKTVKLGEACKIVNGATPSTSVEANWGGPHCWITPAEMGGLSDPYVSKTRRTLTDAGLADCSASLLPTGSVILSSRAPIGHVIINTVPMATNQGCKSMIPRSHLDAKFLFYFIKANVPLLESLGTGATFKELSGGKLASVEIPLPPLTEQQRIVALLDEAFAGIDEAMGTLTKEISQIDSVLQSKFNEVFAQPPIEFEATREETTAEKFSAKGRKATSRNIAGSLSLSVGKPSSAARPGWRWVELSTLAQLESGHTPSRAKSDYWNGKIPWISIRDAKKFHGKIIMETDEYITELGVENSSARILPANTVCLSRTASVGYCTITGRPMATSQDFVNWVIKGELHPEFLKFIFLSEGDQLLRFASGSVHQTIYYPETKAFAVCAPELKEQAGIASHLEQLTLLKNQLKEKLANKLTLITDLKAAVLAQAFAGELTA